MIPANVTPAAALTYDELIFEGRNQAYGAFNLRQHYRPTLNRALGLGVGLFIAALSLPTLYTWLNPNQSVIDQQSMQEIQLTKIEEPPTELPLPTPPVEPPPAVNTVRNLPPVVMPEADVAVDNPPPTTDQLQDATSGTQTADGTGDIEVIAPPEASAPTSMEKAVEAAPAAEAPFVVVEQQPEFPGGMNALRDFLGKSLNYPRAAASAGVSGKVFISFVVNTDGSLADVQVLKGIGFGCDEEALRVIHKMPHWKPGRQSGRTVRVKYNLPISFTLE